MKKVITFKKNFQRPILRHIEIIFRDEFQNIENRIFAMHVKQSIRSNGRVTE